jgi:ABC-type Zn uptake system ZnuABC Zn-binding protein ZnuA
MEKKLQSLSLIVLIGMMLITACSDVTMDAPVDGVLNVVATTTIVGDIVSQVGGDTISVSVLLPVGTDPHSFDPTPRDVAKVSEADVVFVVGGGLEAFLDNLIESADAEDKVISVSEGIDFLDTSGEHNHGAENTNRDEDHFGDPHTWTDPANVMVWVGNIQAELAELDPSNADVYHHNADAYIGELESLDLWIRAQLPQIPEPSRKFLADHNLFSHYADAYGFEQVGTLIPGYSSLAEPTAQEMAQIEDTIETTGVKVILVGYSANSSLAERVSHDTGTRIVYIYTGSLSEPDGDAGTYIAYMRYNTNAIVDALK